MQGQGQVDGGWQTEEEVVSRQNVLRTQEGIDRLHTRTVHKREELDRTYILVGTHHRLATFVELRFRIPPVKSVCNRPSSSANARLLRYGPGPPAMPAILPFFFESRESALPMTGMLRRLIQPPLGFSGRSFSGGSTGARWDVFDSRSLYLDAEQTSQPQYGAWSFD